MKRTIKFWPLVLSTLFLYGVYAGSEEESEEEQEEYLVQIKNFQKHIANK
jgi:hypothetical protein